MRLQRLFFVVALTLSILIPASLFAQCEKANRIVHADVVALDQLIVLNRLGASVPQGMIFALQRDVVPITGTTLSPGNAKLRDGKRPRPLVLRVNQYDCLEIAFTNLLPLATASNPYGQTATRNASVHINGMQLFGQSDDGSWVGQNTSSLVAPSSTPQTYRLYATEQGTFLLYSLGANFSGSGNAKAFGNGNNDGQQQTEGLFGALHVEPPDAEWYRSQVTRKNLDAAWRYTPGGTRTLDYGATAADGTPILRMYTTNAGDTRRTLVHSDLTAVITGPKHGRFNPKLYPCNDPNGPGCPAGAAPMSEPPNPSGCPSGVINPNFSCNYAEPNREQPYREFTIIYHELFEVVQAFTDFYVGPMSTQNNGGSSTQLEGMGTLTAVADQFAINYGTGGIGAEILANRIGVGPMGGCPDCKYEEFFLDSWTVGDPAMNVEVPANSPCTVAQLYQSSTNFTQTCTPSQGQIVNGIMIPNRKAKRALYPDDPSNVYHSYLNDHVKFRILHGGTGFSHVHHQHAHQWLRSPDNNESTYLDSQLINPGSAYTLEITFGGSGNRNKTPGDSIFHCHFYPHFAGGMWSLWRVHDTFEPGTLMEGDYPATGYARALPDAEIPLGTPTPAIVPLPTLPMAPMPADVQLVAVIDPGNPSDQIGTRVEVKPSDLAAGKNPGYPFFVPGISGVRAPHPPLDFACQNADGSASDQVPCKGETLDGGLPRHLFLTGVIANQKQTRYDFSKDLGNINAFQLPEDGTQVERVAMAYHSKCNQPSMTPEGQPGLFQTNGLPPAPGAPYADPGLLPFNPNNPPPGDLRCKPVAASDHKYYRAAAFQTDLVFNKQGWHHPQSRMLSLWQDVMPTINGDRPPEPLFFRVDTDDVTTYWHTNLVPDYYKLDDFQVRTPTDIIGQHIHLVKFDVLASDGASNGFNYEDGTFSPEEVQKRINSINACNGLLTSFETRAACGSGTRTKLTAKAPPPMICGTPNNPCPKGVNWNGAQTTVQRWMADPLMSPAENPKIDRTLRTVFTHDHFGPSTHQQTGLYAAFVVEPPDAQWFQSETGQRLYTRPDGGPTSWEAVILPGKGEASNNRNTYREFAIALQDFQLGYLNTSINQPADPIDCAPGAPGVLKKVNCEWTDPANAISQTNAFNQIPLSQISGDFPSGNNGLAMQGVSAGPSQGTYTFNYRNEPLPYRLQGAGSSQVALSAQATDPSYVFASGITRYNGAVNSQPAFGAPISTGSTFIFPKKPLTFDMQPTDPFTPLLRAYENDNVQVRVIVGAHMLPHSFTMQGLRWRFEPGDEFVLDPNANSGFRSNQAMGISEHFEFLFHVPRSGTTKAGFADFLYMPDASNPVGGRGITEGTWGLLRAYQSKQPKDKPLMPLPNNMPPETASQTTASAGPLPWWWARNCSSANSTAFTVYAQNASLTLNSVMSPQLTLTNALVYTTNQSPQSVTEPLILRAHAGDCIRVTLVNNFNTTNTTFTSNVNSYPFNSPFNLPNNTTSNGGTNPLYAIHPSQRAGLNAALLAYDVPTSSGTNIGFNATEATVAATSSSTKSSRDYYWYAGTMGNDGVGIPTEFGAVNLTPSDPLQHDTYGLVGGMIIEPKGSTYKLDDPSSQASAKVYDSSGKFLFQEFVLLTQDNLNGVSTYKSSGCGNGGNCSTQVALNYRTAMIDPRFPANANLTTIDVSPALSNCQAMCGPNPVSSTTCTGSTCSSGTTPLCDPTKAPGVSGGCWPVTPVFTASAGVPVRLHLLHPGGASDQQVFTINGHIWQDEPWLFGSRVLGWNPESPWIGSRDIYGTNSAYSLLLPSAGGANKVSANYLYRTQPASFFAQGLWGIIRVTPPTP